jgi:hypothetical protein
MSISKSPAKTATKLLKPFKVTAVHQLQPHDPANRVNFCKCILHSVHAVEIGPHLIFSDEA